MQVRSFEIPNADIRALHDYLLGVGGFTFRAGGERFFVLVGERFVAATGTRESNMLIVQSEADMVSVDVVVAGGAGRDSDFSIASQLWFPRRVRTLLNGFADRHNLTVEDLTL